LLSGIDSLRNTPHAQTCAHSDTLTHRYGELFRAHPGAVGLVDLQRLKEELPIAFPAERPPAYVAGGDADCIVDVQAVQVREEAPPALGSVVCRAAPARCINAGDALVARPCVIIHLYKVVLCQHLGRALLQHSKISSSCTGAGSGAGGRPRSPRAHCPRPDVGELAATNCRLLAAARCALSI
jgi:hypothetical protein